MLAPSFNIQRTVYDPKPIKLLAVSAKNEILTKGGVFFLISVNGCTTPEALVAHIVDDFNIPFPVATLALEAFADSEVEGFDYVVSDTWAVLEKGEEEGEEATKFVAFAFSPEEIEIKTALFVEGIKRFKAVLMNYLKKREINQIWAAPATAIQV
ncbi:hypothetical protein EG830_01845 [bacterium]|nr:hypothetical protein [bacterium]